MYVPLASAVLCLYKVCDLNRTEPIRQVKDVLTIHFFKRRRSGRGPWSITQPAAGEGGGNVIRNEEEGGISKLRLVVVAIITSS